MLVTIATSSNQTVSCWDFLCALVIHPHRSHDDVSRQHSLSTMIHLLKTKYHTFQFHNDCFLCCLMLPLPQQADEHQISCVCVRVSSCVQAGCMCTCMHECLHFYTHKHVHVVKLVNFAHVSVADHVTNLYTVLSNICCTQQITCALK